MSGVLKRFRFEKKCDEKDVYYWGPLIARKCPGRMWMFFTIINSGGFGDKHLHFPRIKLNGLYNELSKPKTKERYGLSAVSEPVEFLLFPE